MPLHMHAYMAELANTVVLNACASWGPTLARLLHNQVFPGWATLLQVGETLQVKP